MTRIQWSKQSPARTILQANDLFNEFFSDFTPATLPRWSSPAVNFIENETSFRLEIAAPGFSKEDIQLTVEENVLICKAEKKDGKVHEGDKYRKKEFSISSFTRRFHIPEIVDQDQLNASFENGIMQIVMPKKLETKQASRNIAIQ